MGDRNKILRGRDVRTGLVKKSLASSAGHRLPASRAKGTPTVLFIDTPFHARDLKGCSVPILLTNERDFSPFIRRNRTVIHSLYKKKRNYCSFVI